MNPLLQFLSEMGTYILNTWMIFYSLLAIVVAFLFLISLFIIEKRPINRRRRKCDKEFAAMNRESKRLNIL